MENKQNNFDYSTLYRGFQRTASGEATAEEREEPAASAQAPQDRRNAAYEPSSRDPQMERQLQQELEAQLRNLGQSVSDGLAHGFEGRGQQLGDQAMKFGGAVWDVVSYSLGQAADELKKAAGELKAENQSAGAEKAHRAASRRTAQTSAAAARSNALTRSARTRFGVGLAQSIPGGILAFGLLLGGVICLMAAPYAGWAQAESVTQLVGNCMLVAGAPFAWLTWLGFRNVGVSRRIRTYAEAMGSRSSMSVAALAEAVQQPVKKVRKDIRKLLGKGWMTGWLDSEQDVFYLKAEEWRAALERREAETVRSAQTPVSAPQEADASSEAEKQSAVEPETIRRFVQVLGDEKQLMRNDVAVAELEKMQATSRAICEWVTTHPESAPKARRFVTYYIPTTLKLLHTYNEVKDQQGENADAIRRDIGGILYTLNTAFANLYNALLSDMAMDVSSEIAALQGMLAQDGLSQTQNGPMV